MHFHACPACDFFSALDVRPVQARRTHHVRPLGSIITRQNSVRVQVGPRLELQLVKVQEGLAEGRVLHHRFEGRSAQAVAGEERERAEAAQLKAERRRQQEENVKRKAQEAARETAARQVHLPLGCATHMLTVCLTCHAPGVGVSTFGGLLLMQYHGG